MTRLPDLAPVHEPQYVADTDRKVPLWRWKCTCGAWTLDGHRYRSLAELDYELGHRYPDLRSSQPEHVLRLTEGGFGGVGWACSCYTSGRPEGFKDERRARQSWGRHVTEFTLKWIQAVHKRNLQNMTPEDEEVRRWWAKPEAEREAQAKFMLDQIL